MASRHAFVSLSDVLCTTLILTTLFYRSDEADVFLESRSANTSDLGRNALVSSKNPRDPKSPRIDSTQSCYASSSITMAF